MSIFSIANSLIKKYSELESVKKDDSLQIQMEPNQSETILLIDSLIDKYPNEEKLIKIKEDFVDINNNLQDLQNLIMKSFT